MLYCRLDIEIRVGVGPIIENWFDALWVGSAIVSQWLDDLPCGRREPMDHRVLLRSRGQRAAADERRSSVFVLLDTHTYRCRSSQLREEN